MLRRNNHRAAAGRAKPRPAPRPPLQMLIPIHFDVGRGLGAIGGPNGIGTEPQSAIHN